MDAHTPGPWTWEKHRGSVLSKLRNSDGWVLPLYSNTPAAIANRRLIAAAPQMLAALRAVLTVAPNNADDAEEDPEQAEAWQAVRDALKAAGGDA